MSRKLIVGIIIGILVAAVATTTLLVSKSANSIEHQLELGYKYLEDGDYEDNYPYEIIYNNSRDYKKCSYGYITLAGYGCGTHAFIVINGDEYGNIWIHDITSNEYPIIMSMTRDIQSEESELIQLRKEMQELRRQMSHNTFSNNRNQRLRSFGNKNLARNRLM